MKMAILYIFLKYSNIYFEIFEKYIYIINVNNKNNNNLKNKQYYENKDVFNASRKE